MPRKLIGKFRLVIAPFLPLTIDGHDTVITPNDPEQGISVRIETPCQGQFSHDLGRRRVMFNALDL